MYGIARKVGGSVKRDRARDRHARALDSARLVRVVGQKPDRPDVQQPQHVRELVVVTGVDRQPEQEVRVDRIGASPLQRIGPELVDDADTPAFVAERIDEHATAGLLDRAKGEPQLRAAVAMPAAEHLARHALGVQPREHGFGARSDPPC